MLCAVNGSALFVYVLLIRLLWCFSFRRKDQNKRQIPGSVHGPSASGAGERVSLQSIHHDKKKGRAGDGAQSVGETGSLL